MAKASASTHRKTNSIKGQLTLVATPIGNLQDITLRALETLKACDAIACEDTRHAQKLLQHYGIKKPLLAYHDHNEIASSKGLIERAARGEHIAIISDAGLPLIADPGYRLVQAAINANIPITALPGANAALMALMLSGLPTDRFTFIGFLPSKCTARQHTLAKLKAIPVTLLFYEAPTRLVSTLEDMLKVFGDRNAVVARELTKTFEEVQRGTLQDLIDHYTIKPPKGEIVIVVHGDDGSDTSDIDVDALLKSAMKTHGVKQAAQLVAAETGIAVRELYTRALELKK
jgi:16S rRNA (cytidine1402-2'-O)-methyltransferase